MLQNPCKTFGFKKNMVYEIPPVGGELTIVYIHTYNNKLQALINKSILIYAKGIQKKVYYTV